MTVQLGNVVLDEYLLLNGIETAPDVAVSTVVTLGGVSVTSTMPLSGGRKLSLASVNDGNKLWGKFLYSQVQAVKELASLGMTVNLIHPMGTFQVVIISTADLVPLRKHSNPQPDDWYAGTIQLQEV